MYHDTILKLDAAAMEVDYLAKIWDNARLAKLSKRIFTMAGEIHRQIYLHSPFKTNRRFFNAQWCWSLGHIGILYQMIRWFKLTEPNTQLILETQGKVSNPYFLNALSPFITIVEKLPDLQGEEKANAVYFGCPDGTHHVHEFMKVAEKECKGINLLELSDEHKNSASQILIELGIRRPTVAIQARAMNHDPIRNVSAEQVNHSLAPYIDKGYSVISTGLDSHPIDGNFPSVKSFPNPQLASFLLSASCDQFIGSDSGAWTIPWAYNRPVELINDKTEAWIYQ